VPIKRIPRLSQTPARLLTNPGRRGV